MTRRDFLKGIPWLTIAAITAPAMINKIAFIENATPSKYQIYTATFKRASEQIQSTKAMPIDIVINRYFPNIPDEIRPFIEEMLRQQCHRMKRNA